MLIAPSISCIEVPAWCDSEGLTSAIRCYAYPTVATSPPTSLPPDRELAAEAMTLFLQIESEMKAARADWNQDRFRRLMRLRPKVVARLRRRWAILIPMPRIPLGQLRRRYHANLALYLNPLKR